MKQTMKNKKPTLKTAHEWFKSLPKEERDQAMANTSPKSLKRKYPSAKNALFYSFQWDNTPERFHYWKEIWDKLK